MRNIKVRLSGGLYGFFVFIEKGRWDANNSVGAKSSVQEVLIQHGDRRMVSMD
jgi:hypothetical protein